MHDARWQPVNALEGMAAELILSQDPESGEHTRLTRFGPGADTAPFGAKSQDYPEEIFVFSGRLNDAPFDLWLTAGHDASRPPGERHGAIRTGTGCLVLEMSFPGRTRIVERRQANDQRRVPGTALAGRATRGGLIGVLCRPADVRPVAAPPDSGPAAPTAPGPAR